MMKFLPRRLTQSGPKVPTASVYLERQGVPRSVIAEVEHLQFDVKLVELGIELGKWTAQVGYEALRQQAADRGDFGQQLYWLRKLSEASHAATTASTGSALARLRAVRSKA